MSAVWKTAVSCLWLIAMSWLAWTKILPGMLGGDRPELQAELLTTDPEPKPVCWKIEWRDRTIGFSATQVLRRGDSTLLRSVVHFDDVPLEAMASELFGVLAAVLQSLVDSGDRQAELLVASQVAFDGQQRFAGFQTRVDFADTQDVLQVSGETRTSGVVDVVARLGGSFASGDRPFLRRQIELPPDAQVHDRLTPRSELRNLTVGQTWTVPVYRPFPPNSAPQIVQARVRRHEVIFWGGSDVETMLVEYRTEAGSGINITNAAQGKEWVREDGTVLQQEITFSGLTLRFERLPDHKQDDRAAWLDDAQSPRLWQPIAGNPPDNPAPGS